MNSESRFELVRSLSAAAVALVVTFVAIFFVSKEPWTAILQLISGPFRSLRTFGNVLEVMTPLMFAGIGMLVIYSSRLFNLSADGAFHLGGLVAAIVAIEISLPYGIHPVVAVLLAGLAGVAVTLIPFFIQRKTGANEFVVSLMLNYVCVLLATFLVLNFFRDPNQGTFATYRFLETAKIPVILPGTMVHLGFIFAFVAVYLAHLFLNRTTMGFKVKVTGDNPKFARYIGFNTFQVILASQIVGGFLVGVGGGIEVLGMYTKFTWQTSMGYGWDAVIVSILANNRPKFVPVAAFFLAYLRIGAYVMAMTTDVQNEIIYVAQGCIIILVIGERFLSGLREKQIYKVAKEKLLKEGEA